MTEIIVATSNEGKIKEIKAALPDLDIKWLTARDFPDWPEVDETEPTFEGNAIKKATTLATYFGKLALADDSGLEVDALDGRPGVLSARFSGPESTADLNNAKLLSELTDIPYEQRKAHFSCVIALADPAGKVETAEGSVSGHIVMHAAGDKGFGYDPLFIPDGHDRTMAELDLQEKNKISHRGRALRKMAEIISARLS
jgi:XTP/dITP diphosphohydrolase